MTTLVDALVAILIANWGGGGGGGVVPATIVNIADYRTLTPARDTVDNIYLELGAVNRRQVNNNYCDVTSTVLVTVTSATSDDRLKIIVDECRWICNNVAVTGVSNQKIRDERDKSDRARKVWIYEMTVECIENLVSSSSAYGTPGAEVNMAAALMIGSANAAWIPMTFMGASGFADAKFIDSRFINVGGTDFSVGLLLPLPTNRGGLKLYLKSLMYAVYDADAGDYIDSVILHGINSNTRTDIDTDNTNHDSTGDKTFTGATFPAAVIDCSTYQSILIKMNLFVTDANDLDIQNIRAQCYYDT